MASFQGHTIMGVVDAIEACGCTPEVVASLRGGQSAQANERESTVDGTGRIIHVYEQ